MAAIALGIAAVVGAGATVYASSQAGKAAETQAEAAERAASEGIEAELEMYYDAKATLAPWVAFGETQLGRAENMLAEGMGEFVFDPETQPGYYEGYKRLVEDPTLAGASAGGYLGAPRVQQELGRQAIDYTSFQYGAARDDWVQDWERRINEFYTGAGLGQVASAQTAQNALTVGGDVAELTSEGITEAANARATGYVNQANLYSNLGSGLGQNLLDYYYQQNQGGSGSYGASIPSYQT